MESIPNEIVLHVLLFLDYETLTKSMRVCTLWKDIIATQKKKIVKGIRSNIKKYVISGNIKAIEYCGKIPFEARYKILDWGVKATQEEMIQYAFNNDYLTSNRYTYFGNQYRIMYDLHLIIERNPDMQSHFRSFDNDMCVFFHALGINDLETVDKMIKRYDIFRVHSLIIHGREIAKRIFQTSDKIRDYILDRVKCNDDLIYVAATNGMMDYLTKHLDEEPEYKYVMLRGLFAGANVDMLVAYKHIIPKLFESCHICLLFIDTKTINKNKSDYISFYRMIFPMLRINTTSLLYMIISLLYEEESEIKNKIIYFMVDYLQNELNSSPSTIPIDRIDICDMELVKYFFHLGCHFSNETLRECLKYNRIDILSFLNENGVEIDYYSLVSSIKYDHTVEYETIKWLCENDYIDKNNPLVIKRILKMMDLKVIKLLHEHHMIPTNVFEIIIHFCYSKTDIYHYLYNHGYRINVDRMQQKFEGIDNKWINGIFIKWFHQHGMSLTREMINIFDDGNIGPKWLEKRLRSE